MAAPTHAAPDPGPVASDPDRRRLGWAGVGVAAACFVCGLFTASVLGLLYGLARGFDEQEAQADLGFALVTATGLWVGFLLLPILWALRHGGPARHLGLSARWVDIPLGLAVGLGTTVVTAVVSSVALTKTEQDALEAKAEEVIDRAQGSVGAVLLFLALCVATPLAEEVFFRGLLFRSLHHAAGLVVALLLGGLVFGVVHYDGEATSGMVILVQLGMLSLFGLVLCVLVHRTGRLGAGIVAHAAFNAVTVLSLFAER
jgi:membrane protease YdiL (CAAX protease family)